MAIADGQNALNRKFTFPGFSDGEEDYYKDFFDDNNIKTEEDVEEYFEDHGVTIDYGCPNHWPTPPTSVENANKYYSAKMALKAINGDISGGGGCSGGGGGGSSSSSSSSDDSNNKSEESESTEDQKLSMPTFDIPGFFQLPIINIPSLQIPDLNSFIQNILDTYTPKDITKETQDHVKDQLDEIEKTRDALEATRALNQLADAMKNFDQQKEYTAGLQSMAKAASVISKTITGLTELTPDNIENPLAGDAQERLMAGITADAMATKGDSIESIAEMFNAVADGALPAVTAAEQLVQAAEQQASDWAFAMKTAFADASGAISEAIGLADSLINNSSEDNADNAVRRGNGPCGGRTKAVGGINYNEAEGDEEDAQEKGIWLAKLNTAAQAGNLTVMEEACIKLSSKPSDGFGEPNSVLEPYIKLAADKVPQTKAGILRYKTLYEQYIGPYNVESLDITSNSENDASLNMKAALLESKDKAKEQNTLSAIADSIKNSIAQNSYGYSYT